MVGSLALLIRTPSEQPFESPDATQVQPYMLSRCMVKNRLAETNNSSAFVSGPIGTKPGNSFEEGVASSSTSIMGTTTNTINEAETKIQEVSFPKNIPRSIAHDASSGSIQDIKDFLAKPYRIRTGSLASTDTVSTFSNLVVLNAIATQTIFLNKMLGYLGFRGSAVYTLQVNGNKFQQGRYILAWLPNGGQQKLNTGSGDCWLRMHRFTLMQITQLPHVELDIACNSAVTLKIPYASCWSSTPVANFQLNNQQADLGYLIMVPYVPLSTPSGSSTASYTLWGHFEDVELLGATMPQSGWEPQSGRAKSSKKASTEQEQIEGSIGPIGKTLKKVSLAAGEIAKVPFLTAFAAPVQWAVDIATNVAYIFGWSAPIDLTHLTRVRRFASSYLGNVDTPNDALPLSLLSRNSVGIFPGFAGNDIDEMSIDFVKSVSTYWSQANWTTAQAADTALFYFDLNPRGFVNDYVDTGNTMRCHTTVSYLAYFFAYYRGSIRLTFKLIKTSFHSGRLMFGYIPYESDIAAPAVTADQSAYTHRTILDVRESNEIILEFPFMSNKPYRSLQTATASYGKVAVWVLDPLIAPASVSSTITVLCEISGGQDLEFAVPMTPAFVPVVPTAPQCGWEPQMEGGCLAADTTVGGASDGNNGTIHSQCTMGEKIVSLRALLKRYTVVRGADVIAANVGGFYYPFTWPIGFNNSPAIVNPIVFPDFYGHMCSIYALSRGGVRLKYRMPNTTGWTRIVIGTLDGVSGSAAIGNNNPAATFDSLFGMAAAQLFRSDYSGGIDVQVPQYHHMNSRSNADNICVGTALLGTLGLDTNATTTCKTYVQTYHEASVSPGIYRSGADDANFGLFVSIPPMMNL